jgi:hypothetical protein
MLPAFRPVPYRALAGEALSLGWEIELPTKYVTYVLGAGFSHPLGIPISSGFLRCARRQLASAPEKFGHFREITRAIDAVSRSKNFVNLDLHDIEEVLSLLEADAIGRGDVRGDGVQRFVRDVIVAHTPTMSHWNSEFDPQQQTPVVLFGNGIDWPRYVAFLANLIRCRFVATNSKEDRVIKNTRNISVHPLDGSVEYRIVSLNYDLVIESCRQFLADAFADAGWLVTTERLQVAKLHGSVSGELLPPTWRKAQSPAILEAWQNAYRWLMQSSEIRILGYSMPKTDLYVKYLLAAAIGGCESLEHVDVICLDDAERTVERRYRDMFNFPALRFRSRRVEEYLAFSQYLGHEHAPFKMDLAFLESSHSTFMAEDEEEEWFGPLA